MDNTKQPLTAEQIAVEDRRKLYEAVPYINGEITEIKNLLKEFEGLLKSSFYNDATKINLIKNQAKVLYIKSMNIINKADSL